VNERKGNDECKISIQSSISYFRAGLLGLVSNWVRLAPNGTNLGLKLTLKIPDLFHFGPILWANQGWTLTSVFERLLQSLNLFITLICLEQTGVFLVWNWIAFVFACWCILSMFLFIFELCFWYCLEKENQLFKLGTYHPFKLWLITPVKSSCKQTGFGILDIEII